MLEACRTLQRAPLSAVVPLHLPFLTVLFVSAGLVAAAYLAKAGLDVLVLERRDIVGGAAVTEEIVPGFKFSRASYLAGLLRPQAHTLPYALRNGSTPCYMLHTSPLCHRLSEPSPVSLPCPQIIRDFDLPKYGFKYLSRDPSSFTPTLPESPWGGKSLFLGASDDANWKSIAQFSRKDADAFGEYELFLSKVREIVTPLLDGACASLPRTWRCHDEPAPSRDKLPVEIWCTS